MDAGPCLAATDALFSQLVGFITGTPAMAPFHAYMVVTCGGVFSEPASVTIFWVILSCAMSWATVKINDPEANGLMAPGFLAWSACNCVVTSVDVASNVWDVCGLPKTLSAIFWYTEMS